MGGVLLVWMQLSHSLICTIAHLFWNVKNKIGTNVGLESPLVLIRRIYFKSFSAKGGKQGVWGG